MGLLVFATVLAVALIVGATAPRFLARTAPRRRRAVGPRVYAFARRCGFRHSYMRDALVLRGVGRRWGPVLRLRDGGHGAGVADGAALSSALPAGEAVAGAATAETSAAVTNDVPAPKQRDADARQSAAVDDAAAGASGREADIAALARETLKRAGDVPAAPQRRGRLALTEPLTLPTRARDDVACTIDVVCMPLPRPHHAHRLWQLTAVELESRFIWVGLARTRGEPPPPQLAARFVHDIREDLATRDLRLDAIVVRSGGMQRWPQLGVGDDSLRLLRLPPGLRHERLAANMHARIVGSFWHDVFARDQIGSLDVLRRGLDEWARRRNEKTLATASASAGDS